MDDSGVASSNNLRLLDYQGRWKSNSSKARVATWAGSFFRFRTASRRVRLVLGACTKRGAGPNIVYQVGYEEPRSLTCDGASRIDLQCKAGDSIQEIMVMMSNYEGVLEILDVTSGDGHPIQSVLFPASTARRLLFIGDSLTSGFNPFMKPDAMPLLAFDAYPYQLCSFLRREGHNIRLEVVAYPGIKLVSHPQLKDGMEETFWLEESDASDPDSTDVFVNLGANDRARNSEGDFILKYHKFLSALRKRYPSATLYVIASFGWFTSIVKGGRSGVWEESVEAMSKEIPNTYFIPTQGWILSMHTVDGLHPSADGHLVIARRLQQWLQDNQRF